MFCAALASGESKLHSPLLCDDTLATSDALSKVGVRTVWGNTGVCLIRSDGLLMPSGEIYCRESATTLRFMTAICATTHYAADISGGPSLLKRPVGDLALALQKLGAECTSERGFPPVHVKGPISGGRLTIPGNVSSQYVSALLLVAPLAVRPVEISILGGLESRSYVQMTLNMQSKFNIRLETAGDMSKFTTAAGTYQPCDLQIEGDWSSAAFFFVGGMIAGDMVRVRNLATQTLQPDACLTQVLRQIGGRVSQDSESVTVEKSELTPLEVDVSDCPDLFPAICALSATISGISTIKGIRRLRIKESDRVLAMRTGLRQMGISCIESDDSLMIHGGRPQKATVDPHNDHRIAMAFAALGLCTEELTILDAECTKKSYPSFWPDLESIGAKVTLH
jgi:3-phosphoshikimate 1-carboxyvinyltransferase